jgi:Xaa-Pro aminopeptidase
LTKIIAGWTILFLQIRLPNENEPAMSSTDRSAVRRQNLLRLLKDQPIEALLVSNETNVGYLTGFTGDSSFLLIGQGLCTLVSDGRYTTQIADECPELDVYIRPQTETIIIAAAKVVKKAKLQKLGIEADHLSLAFFEKL